MAEKKRKLSTEPYKGVRDFYPDDMAVQQYLFSVWEQTAESFGFLQYDASVLEPSELYKSKGVENEEIVNEQTYTFTDRGDREVTLRPEMTPTVARMVAGRRQELSFPIRWYSIPNLFRYERTQRGRLREHWQLNCDIFGADNMAADVEIIALAHQIFLNFGADESMFEIRINDRRLMERLYRALGVTDDMIPQITRLNDRRRKMNEATYRKELASITGSKVLAEEVIMMLDNSDEQPDIMVGLAELGIKNVVFDKSLARGFDYYTGTIFEIFDTDPDNNRSMMGGGRYDNLTALFGGDPIPGVGFGFGDVTLRNFLESHNLLIAHIASPTLMIIPTSPTLCIAGEKIAREFRTKGVHVATDLSDKKLSKKISVASETLVDYVLILGDDELATMTFTLKRLADGHESSGTIDELAETITVG